MLPTEKQLMVRSSATAIVPVDKGRDPVGRLDESILRLVREDEADMMIPEVVRAPGVHGRDSHVFLFQKPTAKVTGGDTKCLDVRDEEIAPLWSDESQTRDRSQPSDEGVAPPLVGLHGCRNVTLRTRERRRCSRLSVAARHDPVQD